MDTAETADEQLALLYCEWLSGSAVFWLLSAV
jgi:hypothetical protein